MRERGWRHWVSIVGASAAVVACGSGSNSKNDSDSGPGALPNAGGATGAGGTSSSGGTGSSGASTTGGSANGGGASTGGVANTGAGGTGGTPSDGGSILDGSIGTGCPPGRPDASNTGVPAGLALTTVNGDVTITTDGTTLDAEDIHGFLIVKASHVTVKQCIVRGGIASSNGDGIRVDSGTDILIENTEVALAHPSAFLDGVSGSNFTVRACNIHGGVDGMKVGSNSTVECSYIHDMTSFASDPNQGGGPTHNDAIQILSGTNIHITGNALVSTSADNSAIQVTEDFGTVTDLYIDANFADGGGCSFNFSHKGADSLTGVYATNNRFGRNSFYNCPILKSTKTTLVSSGNVWDDDGTPVPIQTHD